MMPRCQKVVLDRRDLLYYLDAYVEDKWVDITIPIHEQIKDKLRFQSAHKWCFNKMHYYICTSPNLNFLDDRAFNPDELIEFLDLGFEELRCSACDYALEYGRTHPNEFTNPFYILEEVCTEFVDYVTMFYECLN